MSSQVTHPVQTPTVRHQDLPVNVRVKLSGLWASMLFVFAYVDLFSLYRPDVRSKLEAGQVSGFDVGQTFLLATTVYIAIPSLMVFLVLVLRPKVNRIANIVVAARVRTDDRRRRHRRVGLLRVRQCPRGRAARGHRVLRLDVAPPGLIVCRWGSSGRQ